MITQIQLKNFKSYRSGTLYSTQESVVRQQFWFKAIGNRQQATKISHESLLIAKDIKDISFIETPRDEVILQLTETFGGISTPYDAARLSDGTLRVLSIAAAMLSAPEQSLVVIEEIDNGVHPSRAADLLNRISNIAKERNLRVLISSHNPALLDALPDDAIPETEFCYRNPKDGSSQLIDYKIFLIIRNSLLKVLSVI